MSTSSDISDDFEECEEDIEDTTISSSILEDVSYEEYEEIGDDENVFSCESDTKITINLATQHNEINLEKTISLHVESDDEHTDEESNYDSDDESSTELSDELNSSKNEYKSSPNNSDNNKENKGESTQVFLKCSKIYTGSSECINNPQNNKNFISNNEKTIEILDTTVNKVNDDINNKFDEKYYNNKGNQEDDSEEEEEGSENEEEDEEEEEEINNCIPNSISTAIFNYIRWSKVSKIDEYDYIYQNKSSEESEEDEEEQGEIASESEKDNEEVSSLKSNNNLIKDLNKQYDMNVIETNSNILKDNFITDNKYNDNIEFNSKTINIIPVNDKNIANDLKIYPKKYNAVDDKNFEQNLFKEIVNDEIETNECKNTADMSYTILLPSSNERVNKIENLCDMNNEFDDLRNSLEIENEILYEMLFRWLIKKIKKLKQIEGEVDIEYFKKLFGENMKDVKNDYPDAYDKLYTLCMNKVRNAIANEEY
uniref:Asparagine-rich antigen n=1 Tax=Strongyloides venezuelensis TaxID=75913 RepID=A0A0K0FAI5_STRVS